MTKQYIHTLVVERIMRKRGFEAISTGGGCWAWSLDACDDSTIWICTGDQALGGDPYAQDWLLGRHGRDGGYSQCNDYLTLSDALRLMHRLPSPMVAGAPEAVELTREQLMQLSGG